MRVIVLAAGQGFQLDGFNKLLIRDPVDNKLIIEKYREAFDGMDLSIVLGYRAINVMNKYPDFDYVYNSDWAVTNNSYSLNLSLNDEPCYVISGDLFIEPELVTMLENYGPNLVLTKNRESRSLSALNVSTDNNGYIQELYQGKLRKPNDPEAIGIYKISSPEILKKWRRNCREYGNLFAGQNLPYDLKTPVVNVDIQGHRLDEINTPMDYIRLLNRVD